MEIQIIITDAFENRTETVVINDFISPEDGYTESYLNRTAKEYADNRAVEQFDGVAWEVESVQLLNA